MCVSAEAWPFTTFTATAIFLDSSTHARTRPNEPSPTYEKQLVLRKTSCSSQTSNQIWPPEIYWRSMIHKNHTAINPNWHYCCMLLSESGKSHGTTYPPTSLVTLHLHGFSVSKVFPVCSCVAFFFTTYLPELPNFIPRVHWKCGVSRFHLPEWHGNQTKESMCKREMERPWQRRKLIKDDAKMTNTNPKFKSKGHLSPCEKKHAKRICFPMPFSIFFGQASLLWVFALISALLTWHGQVPPGLCRQRHGFPFAFSFSVAAAAAFQLFVSFFFTCNLENGRINTMPSVAHKVHKRQHQLMRKNICLQGDPTTYLKKLCASICGSICCWSLGIWSCFDIILGINSINSVHSYPHTTPVHSEAGIAKHMLIS